MTDHVGNLTESTKKATRNHMGEFSKDLKLSEKVVFLHDINGQLGIKIWKTIIYKSIKNMKYLWINLTRDVQDLYTAKYKTLLTLRTK